MTRDIETTDHSAIGSDRDWTSVPDRLIPERSVPSDRHWKAERNLRFVKGPLHLDWLGVAARCGHAKALPVLLALKVRADAGREEWVKPPALILESLGVHRMDRSRAIMALEKSGLIEVRRRAGRPPLVRLLPWRQ